MTDQLRKSPMQTLIIVIEGDNPEFAADALRKAIERIDRMLPAPVTLTGFHRRTSTKERERAMKAAYDV